MSSAHSCFQILEGIVDCGSLTESIIFKENCEGSCNFTIIMNKLVIIALQTQEAMQIFNIFQARPILHRFNFLWIHPETILVDNMSQVLNFRGSKNTFRLLKKMFVLR
jgi:hypothetical protein